MVNEVIKLDNPIMTKTGKEAAELDRHGKTVKDYLLMAAILALLIITWKCWSPLLRKMF